MDLLHLPHPASPISLSCSRLDDPLLVEESASVSGSDSISVTSYHSSKNLVKHSSHIVQDLAVVFLDLFTFVFLVYPLLGHTFEQLDRLEILLKAVSEYCCSDCLYNYFHSQYLLKCQIVICIDNMYLGTSV